MFMRYSLWYEYLVRFRDIVMLYIIASHNVVGFIVHPHIHILTHSLTYTHTTHTHTHTNTHTQTHTHKHTHQLLILVACQRRWS